MKKVFKRVIIILLACVFIIGVFAAFTETEDTTEDTPDKKDFIKWIDFNAGGGILKKLYDLDLKYHNSETEFKFTEALAYLTLKNGNKFSEKTDSKNLDKLLQMVKDGKKISEMYPDNKYYKYYFESYTAIFSGILGNYQETEGGEIKYGIRGYFPLAKGYWFSHYDDFGNSRSYGYKRKHLGHDMMGGQGTPIISVEGGVVAECGWNQYGGWRVGVRSFDTKRYYYYAHLRKGKPFPADLKVGDTVKSGQVIGYLGNTGYSRKEDVNLSSGKPHLHFGLQLIFDESQIKGSKEIWVDVYGLCNFLAPYRAKVTKNSETKDYISLDTKIMV